MREIWIPLGLIAFFLFLHIVRPYIKKLRAIDGLAWLPLLAFLAILALIPAYGFRPETIPLLLYSAVLSVSVIFKQINGDIKFRNFRKGKFAFLFSPLLFLAVFCGIAFYFTPQKDLSLSAENVYPLSADDYYIRLYADKSNMMDTRPLLILLPPTLASIQAIDETAGKLRDQGFVVLAFARNGDLSFAEKLRAINAFFSAHRRARANKQGMALEEKRKIDLRFILSYVQQNPIVTGTARLFDMTSKDSVFIAAFDTGGSAAILLEDYLLKVEITVRGIAAVESPLWSLYKEETVQLPETPAEAGWFHSVGVGLYRWFLEVRPKKIDGMKDVPELSIPVLFLVSDWSRDAKFAKGRYMALLECFNSSDGYAILASIDGTGPLDYSGFPALYPVISAILNGHEAPPKADEAAGHTAALITNFAESILNADKNEFCPLVRTELLAEVQIKEKRNKVEF